MDDGVLSLREPLPAPIERKPARGRASTRAYAGLLENMERSLTTALNGPRSGLSLVDLWNLLHSAHQDVCDHLSAMIWPEADDRFFERRVEAIQEGVDDLRALLLGRRFDFLPWTIAGRLDVLRRIAYWPDTRLSDVPDAFWEGLERLIPRLDLPATMPEAGSPSGEIAIRIAAAVGGYPAGATLLIDAGRPIREGDAIAALVEDRLVFRRLRAPSAGGMIRLEHFVPGPLEIVEPHRFAPLGPVVGAVERVIRPFPEV